MNREMFTVYSTALTAIAGAAGAPGNANISFEADSDFEIHAITGTAVQANVIVVNWAGTVQVTYSGTNTTFFNTPIPHMEIAGDGRQLYWLRKPQLVKANSVLVVTWANSAAATATNASLSFHGYKIPLKG